MSRRRSEELISEEWLIEVGFKWHQISGQPTRHWCLWFGDAVRARDNSSLTATEDLGIEIAGGSYAGRDRPEGWFCWFRSDAAGRYHRFIHLRHLTTRGEVIAIVEALSGQAWNPDNHIYGCVQTPEAAARHRAGRERLDRKMLEEGPSWYEAENDPTMSRALPEHLDEHLQRTKRRAV